MYDIKEEIIGYICPSHHKICERCHVTHVLPDNVYTIYQNYLRL